MTYLVKVTVINGSPRRQKGYTGFILKPFINGMKKAGGTVNVYYPSEMKIKPCIGNLDCWESGNKECIINDEMQEMYSILRETDILALASPVYIPLPSKMQIFINRLCALLNPKTKFIEGRTRVSFRENVKISKILGLITGGWWEIENLDTVLTIFKEFAKIASVEFIGAILRPHTWLLKENTQKNKEILDKIESLGKQVIKSGQMDKKDLDFVSQPLTTEPELRKMLNKIHS